jgi:TRAP-type C4-dicarboxylate transport system permease small subunit
MNALHQIDKVLTALIRLILGVTSAVIFVVTFLAVIFRYILKAPLPWSQDVIRLAFTYMIYFGAAYCVRDSSHLNVDVLLTMLSKRGRKIAEILINIVLLCFFIFLVVYGFTFAQMGYIQTTSYLMLPMTYYYLGIPLAAIGMIFYVIQNILNQVKDLKEGRNEA